MNSKPIKFPQTNAPHIVGQPFTVNAVSVPMNMKLTCNCGGESVTVEIIASIVTPCPSCGRFYNAIFNPTNGQIEMQIATPQTRIPS